jgi:hypothetical protein
MPIAHYGALLLLFPCPNFSRKYRKSPAPLCALSKLADIVVNPSKNSILMKRKTPISASARLKSPNNPPRGRYRTGGLGDAVLKVQQTSEAQFHGPLEENPDAIIIVDLCHFGVARYCAGHPYRSRAVRTYRRLALQTLSSLNPLSPTAQVVVLRHLHSTPSRASLQRHVVYF